MTPCSVPGCGREAKAKTYCASHYRQHQRGATLRPLGPPVGKRPAGVRVNLRVTPGAARRVASDRLGARAALESWAKR